MDLLNYLSNMTSGRIMQVFCDDHEHTTKEIAEYLSDVPAPTIYRHINSLIEGGMIQIKEERKVRGSRERVLAASDAWSKSLSMSELSYPYFMELLNRFKRYEKDHQHLERDEMFKKDRLFLQKMVFCLDDEYMDRYIDDLNELTMKYLKISQESKGKKVKLRNINVISAPTEFE